MDAEIRVARERPRFAGRDLLTLADYTGEEISIMLDVAALLKEEQRGGKPHRLLAGKNLGMIFQKSSTRTRVSFEAGMFQLGGHALYLNANDLQLGRGESIADTARVLCRYLDGVMIRTFAQADVEELARYSSVPVINGLTDLLHPCQVLADLLTVREARGRLEGLKVAFLGDGNNMAHSWLLGGTRLGMRVAVACPPGYEPAPEIVARARERGEALVTHDPREAAAGADVLVTDVWASMGQEAEREERQRAFSGFQVNGGLAALAGPDHVFLHCLPAHRGEEVTAELIDGPHSLVWEEAENRLHVQKAVLALLL